MKRLTAEQKIRLVEIVRGTPCTPEFKESIKQSERTRSKRRR